MKKFALLFALFLLMSSGVKAALQPMESVICNFCTDAQMRNKIERETPLPSTKQLLVIDIAQEIARQYIVTKNFDNWGEPQTSTVEISISPQLQDVVNNIFLLRQQLIIDFGAFPADDFTTQTNVTPQNSSFYFRVPHRQIIADPYDFVQSSSVRRDVYNVLTNTLSGQSRLLVASTVGFINSLLLTDLGISMTVVFVDRQGNKIGEAIVAIDVTREELVVLNAFDQASNRIPQTVAQVPGSYSTVSAAHNEAFVNYMNTSYSINWDVGSVSSAHYCQVVTSNTTGNRTIYRFNCN
ncbi:hypothetical protein [Alkalimonas amylolytica]|uniref:Uncharacterized protein n=1 Tax=Alkalimonas amylolytica TaxID=152573 RepID=A0A1H4E0L7_ALKAM|nr:hypothetical protein [Alkalimonas amylolytica]SEA78561.1 hypothetical protein SAMN04488051_106145 [Alkalimonas amylolytica]